jgi:hypothetical protein
MQVIKLVIGVTPLCWRVSQVDADDHQLTGRILSRLTVT